MREAFVFDNEIDEGELARIRAEAYELAEVAGFDLTGFRPAASPAAAVENAAWRVANTWARLSGRSCLWRLPETRRVATWGTRSVGSRSTTSAF